jgi:hypothetical protein
MSAISLATSTSASTTPLCGRYIARLDASFEDACAALDELQPPSVFARALAATCSADADTSASSSLYGERVLSVEALLEEGPVTVSWVVSITGRGTQATGVSIASSIAADEPAAMERMLDAWTLVGPAVDRQTRRIARRVQDAAEGL